jgi:acyl-CoA synthetase (NDP forming)
MDEERIRVIASAAMAEGRSVLTELEGMDILDAVGIETPRRVFVRDSVEAVEAARLCALQCERVVVKVVSSAVPHKTEVGGVVIALNTPADVRAAVERIRARLRRIPIEGFSIHEYVEHGSALGREIIAGIRFTLEFGPVVSIGFGGIYAEYIAKSFRPGAATLIVSPLTVDLDLARTELSRNALQAILSGGLRGTKPILGIDTLASLALKFSEAAPLLAAAGVLELEVNPFAVCGEGATARLVALDALGKVGKPHALVEARSEGLVYLPQALRPTAKIRSLLRPANAAIIGVSAKEINTGRIILRNMIGAGFARDRLYVVKPGLSELEGCPCVPDIPSLPGHVDLVIVAVSALAASALIAELIERDAAESIVVIPGGFEEKSGGEGNVSRIHTALTRARSLGGGPVIVGGNCLGALSVPGSYNTLFIPDNRLPRRAGACDPVAIISQSGAFAITRISNHPELSPRYVVTCGNQMDATIGDFLEQMADDESIRIFALYIEGFKPLDGEKALRACRRIRASGRTVIVYRAGRSAAGAAASASHTASIAGDYAVTAALFRQAGALVAESLEQFDDALSLFSLLDGKARTGRRLGALSNAGFECVAMADNLNGFTLAEFAVETRSRLEAVFKASGVESIADIHNPLDLTPMADEAVYESCLRAVLEDPGVDCAIVGLVPLSASLRTLSNEFDHEGDPGGDEGIVERLCRLKVSSSKPWVAVVDSGPLYDGLVRKLERGAVPTFRSSDRALAALGLWASASCPSGICE